MATFTPSRDQLTEDRDSELWKSLDNKDLYKVLGVQSDASSKDIEKAFRRKSRDCHPDKHKDALSTERFKELSNARELLLDPGRRWWYDYRREKEAEVIARALQGAKLRAQAEQEEDRHSQDLAADEEKRRQDMALEKEKLEKFVEQAKARARVLALKADDQGYSSDEDGPVQSGQLRASAPEFVPAGGHWASGAPCTSAPTTAPGAAAASAAPVEARVVEVYSISAQRWCLGFVVNINPLPGGRAALTVQYQVREGQWNEKMLYDHDPNLRRRAGADGFERDVSTDLWNQWKAQQENGGRAELRAEAPAFVPNSHLPPSAPAWPGAQPRGPPMHMPPSRQIQVTVPPGCRAGQHINIVTDAGRHLTVQVPPGLMPGQTFLCTELLGMPQNWQPRPGMSGMRPPHIHPGFRKSARTSDDSRCLVL